MKFKRFTALLAAGAFAAMTLLSGCTQATDNGMESGSEQKAEEKSDDKSAETTDGKVYKIGLCQLVQHEALDAATLGFEDKLKELLGKDNVEFDLQNAAGDSPTCATIANQFVSDGDDLIFANATPALQAAAAATSDIPIVGTSITDYATALDIDNWDGTTGRNITGTCDLAPLDKQAEMFKELLPDAKNIGLVYCSSEANSKYQIDNISAELAKLGFNTTEYSFADSNDIAAVVTTACEESDALYIPTDNTAASNAELIANIAMPAKTPIIAGEEGICNGCGIATLSISYYSIGEEAAQMAYEILKNGEKPENMKVRYSEVPVKKYIKSRVEELGIKVPDDYEETDVM